MLDTSQYFCAHKDRNQFGNKKLIHQLFFDLFSTIKALPQ